MKSQNQSLKLELRKKKSVIVELYEYSKNLSSQNDKIKKSISWRFLTLIGFLPKKIGVVDKILNLLSTSKSNLNNSPPIPNKTLKQKKHQDVYNPYKQEIPEIKTNQKSGLAVLAIPCTLKEKQEIIDNFKLWDEDKFCPYVKAPKPSDKIPIVIILNSFHSPNFEAEILLAFNNTRTLKKSFLDIHFFYCNLYGENDLYTTIITENLGPQGTKAGPNNQFFLSMRMLKQFGDYAFYMEPDCYPIKPNWLGQLETIVENSEPFWIKGSIYRGVSHLDEKFKEHLNGNSIYAVGDPTYQIFIKSTIYPFLRNIVIDEFPNLAYDCAIQYYFQEAISYVDKSKWQVFQRTKDKFVATSYIQNHSGQSEAEQGFGVRIKDIIKEKDTFVVHGRHLKKDIKNS